VPSDPAVPPGKRYRSCPCVATDSPGYEPAGVTLAEVARLRGMVEGLAGRVAEQSDLLSRRAETAPEPTTGDVIRDDDRR
jgi:hypothetical protein